MKTLRGYKISDSDYADMERQLKALFKKIIFDPIIDLLAPHNAQVKAAKKTLKNSKVLYNAKYDSIVTAINAGQIQYFNGTFSGNFNATLSAALKSYGAQFNKQTKTFSIVPEALPNEVRESIKNYAARARKYHEDLEDELKNIQFSLTYQIEQFPVDTTKTIVRLDDKFQDQYGDALGIPEMSDTAQKKLSRMYLESLRPYIKKFSNEQIADLRSMVSDNAREGYRFDYLVDRIQQRYDVSMSKASFLARQETSIFVAKARQVRFGDVGITKYVWRTSHDSEVRSDHKKLDGREFEYRKPPIVDEATGRKGNPGEDYNCRCIADPVISNVLEAVA